MKPDLKQRLLFYKMVVGLLDSIRLDKDHKPWKGAYIDATGHAFLDITDFIDQEESFFGRREHEFDSDKCYGQQEEAIKALKIQAEALKQLFIKKADKTNARLEALKK